MKKSGGIIFAILCIIILVLVGFIIWDKVIKNNEKTTTTNNTTNVMQNTTITNVDENKTVNKATTPSKLMVNREGTEEEIPSKEYSSTYGYTIRYSTEFFKVSNHDDQDWFVRDEDTNGVVVRKENVTYSNKIASLSNYKNTTINGYESVYTTRRVEGQYETTYYINVGKDYIYEITTSCQDSPEFLEGLGNIMTAMVHTFAIK